MPELNSELVVSPGHPLLEGWDGDGGLHRGIVAGPGAIVGLDLVFKSFEPFVLIVLLFEQPVVFSP